MNRMLRSMLLMVVFLTTTLCSAQVTVSTNQLDGTEWELISVTVSDRIEYSDDGDVTIFKFNMSSYSDSCYYGMIEMDRVFQRPYYISDTEPSYTYFDRSKVGVNATGKYIVDYNDILNAVDYFTIISFNSDEMVLLHKAPEDALIRLDAYLTLKRVRKNE